MPTWLNTNTFHNVANAAMVLLAMATAGILATGCTTLATGTIDCSMSWLPVQDTVWAIGGIGVLKLIVNITRDGVAGLFKPQPPVQQ